MHDDNDESFVFYKSFLESILEIRDPTQRLEMFETVCKYGIYGEMPGEDAPDYMRALMKQFTYAIDRAKERRNTARINGAKGGAPRGNKNAAKDKASKQENKPKQAKTTKNNLNGNVNGNVNGNGYVNGWCGGNKKQSFNMGEQHAYDIDAIERAVIK